ncbi:ABC transporter substrate-binding protein [Necropsobacter massiliensis]|uniref:ABC transporter substrate-binding protein n=1 Tax=Necropsobacter massiliensis TaxID=1400001 RepID=UPI000595FC9B|nr:extracellular solute-binding protein [Necropsobacter massiliensis]
MKKFLCLLFLFYSLSAQAIELVIGTTFSFEATEFLVKQWQTYSGVKNVRLINRTTHSLEQLFNQPHLENVDVILSSSPVLFHNLSKKQLLLPLPEKYIQVNNQTVPNQLQQYIVPIAYSGYGILSNRRLLRKFNLSEPKSWYDLLNPKYGNNIAISSPSRSGTNLIILEMLLQQKGWQQGWRDIMQLSAYISSISSRSFNVTDQVQTGLSISGITIDSYALNLKEDTNLVFHYFPQSIISATFLAIHKNTKNKHNALSFIDFLLSDKGQNIISSPNFAKYPINNKNLPFSKSHLNYDLMFSRQLVNERLFDIAITFRLNQLKEIWKTTERIEKKENKNLDRIRSLLTEIPVTITQIEDKTFLERFNQDKTYRLQQENSWEQFFQERTEYILSLLEER